VYLQKRDEEGELVLIALSCLFEGRERGERVEESRFRAWVYKVVFLAINHTLVEGDTIKENQSQQLYEFIWYTCQ